MTEARAALREPDAVARRLDQARQARGYSWRQLGQLAGVPGKTLSAIHTGRRRGENLALGQSLRLCVVLEISLDWLAGRWRDDPSLPGPPGQDAWQLLWPGEWQHLVGRLRVEPIHDLRSINDADP
jgi:transcriptional regulator with XRE-family HTH domain